MSGIPTQPGMPSPPKPVGPIEPIEPKPRPRPHGSTGHFLLDTLGQRMLHPDTGAFLIYDPNADPCCPEEPGEPCPRCDPGTTPSAYIVSFPGVELCSGCLFWSNLQYINNREVSPNIAGPWTCLQLAAPCGFLFFTQVGPRLRFDWWPSGAGGCIGPGNSGMYRDVHVQVTLEASGIRVSGTYFASSARFFHGFVPLESCHDTYTIPNNLSGECDNVYPWFRPVGVAIAEPVF